MNDIRKKTLLSDRSKKERRRKNISRIITLLLLLMCAVGACLILREDRQRANAPVEEVQSKSPIKVNRKRDYGEAGFQKVAENDYLILCADFTTGEISVEQKDTGMIWYSNPQSRTESGIQGPKGRLSSQIYLTAFNVLTEASTTMDSNGQSVKQGGMDYELIENGVLFRFSFPTPGIVVPVRYTLVDDTLEVSIPMDQLEEQWSEQYVALNIDVLPFFGAAELDDQGYMLIPDGSGSLIKVNGENYALGPYSDNIYGTDAGLGSVRETTVKENISLPVYGMKTDNGAFIAVITDGAANSKVDCYQSRKTTSYNQVYSQAQLRKYDTKSLQVNNVGTTEESQYRNDMTDNLLLGEDYTVRYFFLSEDQANYSGMSNRYRKYLQEVNMLHESDLAEKQYLILDVYGAVGLQKYVAGVQRTVVTPLTKYTEVCDIVRDLKAQHVDNLIINYIGGTRGGMEQQLQDELQYEPALGTKKEFEEMIAYLQQEGVVLFFEADPLRMYAEGNGYTRSADTIKTFFDDVARQNEYMVNRNGDYATGRSWYLLSPKLIPDFIQEYTASAVEQDVKNIAVYGLGSMIYSDLNERGSISRSETIKLWQSAMARVQEQADHLLVHQGNLYSIPYADVIVDAASGSSGYDIEESSVPFYQMVLHGNIVLGTKAINTTADYEYAFLKAMESGSSLKFNVMAVDETSLVNTEYNDMVSYNWSNWMDIAVEYYHRMNAESGSIASENIVLHEIVAEGVTRTVYASGTAVLVNYNDVPFEYNGVLINGRDFAVTKGEE